MSAILVMNETSLVLLNQSISMEDNWLDMCDLDENLLTMTVVVKELMLVSTYVYISLSYAWLRLVNSYYEVTYFNFLRWVIEASYLFPRALIRSLVDYVLFGENIFASYFYFYKLTVIIKMVLFFWMRYAEAHPDFFLNEFQLRLFKIFCDRISK